VYSGAHEFRTQTSLCWQTRSETEVRTMPSSYMIMLQATQQTPLRTLNGVAGGQHYATLPMLSTFIPLSVCTPS
jgi:hypothetical protein